MGLFNIFGKGKKKKEEEAKMQAEQPIAPEVAPDNAHVLLGDEVRNENTQTINTNALLYGDEATNKYVNNNVAPQITPAVSQQPETSQTQNSSLPQSGEGTLSYPNTDNMQQNAPVQQAEPVNQVQGQTQSVANEPDLSTISVTPNVRLGDEEPTYNVEFGNGAEVVEQPNMIPSQVQPESVPSFPNTEGFGENAPVVEQPTPVQPEQPEVIGTNEPLQFGDAPAPELQPAAPINESSVSPEQQVPIFGDPVQPTEQPTIIPNTETPVQIEPTTIPTFPNTEGFGETNPAVQNPENPSIEPPLDFPNDQMDGQAR